ncbi:helix-turn-helix domain-containing protein [Streptomyces sp. NBC_00638]|uniref:ArsR/SmtB family transcription factor n=1 Tax=unclassified Streptomyces TaxID=2593676 RepID=UPI00224F506C|nr:helix-turn-helix domain-containing protein [Streptomyces sp. NBC_00638]MCX5008992.1 helix-turn-helix domain-containing protein [Streptomyces sp. NBC_00638]
MTYEVWGLVGVGMLRIHFTTEDLLKTRVVSAPDPMWELVLSVFRLRRRLAVARYEPWYRQVKAEAARSDLLQRIRLMLMPMIPASGYFPDFLTPENRRHGGIEPIIEAVAGCPRSVLRSQLDLLDRGRGSAWLERLYEADSAAREDLQKLLRDYHRIALVPHWNAIRNSVETDRASRTRALLDGGVHGLLHSYRPLMRWTPPVLHVRYSVDQTLHLNGRGLLLAPSHFGQGPANSLADPALPPVLVYPAGYDQAAAPVTVRALGRLMGGTRASILIATETATTSGELARRVGVSAATVSHHLSALRAAGLLSTLHQGELILHTRTSTGSALVNAAHTAGT